MAHHGVQQHHTFCACPVGEGGKPFEDERPSFRWPLKTAASRVGRFSSELAQRGEGVGPFPLLHVCHHPRNGVRSRTDRCEEVL